MTENQHRQISGYRDLTQEEIDLMNIIKMQEEAVMALVGKVRAHVGEQIEQARENAPLGQQLSQAEPIRWQSIAKTHFQQGFMALIRAVAQPQSPN